CGQMRLALSIVIAGRAVLAALAEVVFAAVLTAMILILFGAPGAAGLMPARSPRCGQKSRAAKPGLHPRLPPKRRQRGPERSAGRQGEAFGAGGADFAGRRK